MPPRIAVVVYPGTNCEHDVVRAMERLGASADLVWHGTSSLAGYDAAVLPGGFAHGDYLRPGALARFSPVTAAVAELAAAGGPVVGICNGFQVLTEAGLLPGSLEPNEPPGFRCRPVSLSPRTANGPFGRAFGDAPLTFPIAHAAGRYVVDDRTRRRLWDEGRVLATYADAEDPNGSVDRIAGITDETGRIAGLMPHPERAADPRLGRQDGLRFFENVAALLDDPAPSHETAKETEAHPHAR